jgi:L-amino acid N-acyltransferase YncA
MSDPGTAGRKGLVIRAMEAADAASVLAIYQAGLDTGQASFETEAPSWGRSTRRSCRATGMWPPTR